jgi:hypothetical protein
MVRVAILRDARRARSFGMSAIALIPEMTAERGASIPAFAGTTMRWGCRLDGDK